VKIVCAASLTAGREAFSTAGELTVLPERAITAESVRDAGALAIRSKVRVNAALLDGSSVRFVGTATAGTDHMDLDYLQARGIRWCAAPGCNANSVAEYLVAGLLTLATRHRFTLAGRTIAVVGVGHIGRLVCAKARLLGLRVLQNDPPLAEASGDSVFRPLAEILPQADIVTLHVPLTDDGPHATRGLADASFFAQMKPGALLVSACRGEVVDESALRQALDRGIVRHTLLDVFDHEPAGPLDLMQRADLISPHIAGYSHQGKLNGTAMVYQSLCQFCENAPRWTPPQAVGLPDLAADATGRTSESVLAELVRQAYDIEADDRALRAGLDVDPVARGRHFEQLRARYPERHEFAQYRVALTGASAELRRVVAALGFREAGMAAGSAPTAG
jgi:erythronate-4-phosphate dehydrogenase